MSDRLVSVLVPTYNGARFVDAAMASIVGQTWPDLEILVGDDASSDDTVALVEQWAARDERVRVIARPANVGAEENCRLLYAEARGAFIKFVNQDDLLAERCVERLVTPLLDDPAIALATSKRRRIDVEGRPLPDVEATQQLADRDVVVEGTSLGDLVLRTNLNVIGEPTTVLFRRAAIDAADLFRLGSTTFVINADLALWLRLLGSGRAFYAAEELSCFRIHDDQRSARPSTAIDGTLEWLWLIDEASPVGFLESVADERAALASFVRNAGAVIQSAPAQWPDVDVDLLPLVEGVEAAAERLRSVTPRRTPRCSIVIPVFNKVEYTQKCLEALAATTPESAGYEVVIVDNASTDATGDLLACLDGDVQIIRNPVNRGFAAACNQGAAAARGEYLLFLNNDTEPQAGWLEPLLAVLDREPDVGAVGARLLFPDGTLQHAGVAVVENRQTGIPLEGRHRFYRQPGDWPPALRRADVQVATAACLLVRRSAFAAVGGFDEGYWNGNEDVDLCFSLGAAGWRIVYEPRSSLVHHESVSGPERWSKVGDNIVRLVERWAGQVVPDYLVTPEGVLIVHPATAV